MAVFLMLHLPEQTLGRYARAARQLRRVMGSDAPTTIQLMAHELSDRAPAVIVADYAERLKRRKKR